MSRPFRSSGASSSDEMSGARSGVSSLFGPRATSTAGSSTSGGGSGGGAPSSLASALAHRDRERRRAAAAASQAQQPTLASHGFEMSQPSPRAAAAAAGASRPIPAAASSPSPVLPLASHEDDDLALARRLQAEEDEASARSRAPMFRAGPGAASAARAGGASWRGLSGSSSGGRGGSTFDTSPQEDSDFLFAQRIEQQELARLQDEERARSRSQRSFAGSESSSSGPSALRSAMAARSGNNSREAAAGAAAGGSRSRLGSLRPPPGFDAGGEEPSARSLRSRARGDDAALPDELAFLMQQLHQGLRGGAQGGGELNSEYYNSILHELLSRGGVSGRGSAMFGRGRGRRTDELDIDNMSYDDLLALSERIGEVKSKGLSKTEVRRLPVSTYTRRKKVPANRPATSPTSSPTDDVLTPTAAASSSSASLKRKSDDESDNDSVIMIDSPVRGGGARKNKKQKHRTPAASAASSSAAASSSSPATFPFGISPHKPIFPSIFAQSLAQRRASIESAGSATDAQPFVPPTMGVSSPARAEGETVEQRRAKTSAYAPVASAINAFAPAAAAAAASSSPVEPKDEYETEDCCICLNELEEGEAVKRLGCMHVFHASELDEWLRQNKVCPICRVPALQQ